eukprot:CAMPEP_0179850352 /NCGR_PEP_ID=MMETSP0982-20121206/7656_1 /TAXON_ID=483367 /ORGANISM="non described non described, Strain CCMP 2436" /LENGTH=92 /DNA_ID=CAMNT_0021735769 /DNA_START=60 /DNA_END=336 /DNA_ORIENTATION=-
MLKRASVVTELTGRLVELDPQADGLTRKRHARREPQVSRRRVNLRRPCIGRSASACLSADCTLLPTLCVSRAAPPSALRSPRRVPLPSPPLP